MSNQPPKRTTHPLDPFIEQNQFFIDIKSLCDLSSFTDRWVVIRSQDYTIHSRQNEIHPLVNRYGYFYDTVGFLGRKLRKFAGDDGYELYRLLPLSISINECVITQKLLNKTPISIRGLADRERQNIHHFLNSCYSNQSSMTMDNIVHLGYYKDNEGLISGDQIFSWPPPEKRHLV